MGKEGVSGRNVSSNGLRISGAISVAVFCLYICIWQKGQKTKEKNTIKGEKREGDRHQAASVAPSRREQRRSSVTGGAKTKRGNKKDQSQ